MAALNSTSVTGYELTFTISLSHEVCYQHTLVVRPYGDHTLPAEVTTSKFFDRGNRGSSHPNFISGVLCVVTMHSKTAWQELHGTTNHWSNNFLNDKQL
jgi:hypothetical protein